jgi:4-alpha-glucanotransferase
MVSSAIFSIALIQDILSLGADDRMNRPGQSQGLWSFRYTKDMLTDSHAEKLAYLTEISNRCRQQPLEVV